MYQVLYQVLADATHLAMICDAIDAVSPPDSGSLDASVDPEIYHGQSCGKHQVHHHSSQALSFYHPSFIIPKNSVDLCRALMANSFQPWMYIIPKNSVDLCRAMANSKAQFWDG